MHTHIKSIAHKAKPIQMYMTLFGGGAGAGHAVFYGQCRNNSYHIHILYSLPCNLIILHQPAQSYFLHEINRDIQDAFK